MEQEEIADGYVDAFRDSEVDAVEQDTSDCDVYGELQSTFTFNVVSEFQPVDDMHSVYSDEFERAYFNDELIHTLNVLGLDEYVCEVTDEIKPGRDVIHEGERWTLEACLSEGFLIRHDDRYEILPLVDASIVAYRRLPSQAVTAIVDYVFRHYEHHLLYDFFLFLIERFQGTPPKLFYTLAPEDYRRIIDEKLNRKKEG